MIQFPTPPRAMRTLARSEVHEPQFEVPHAHLRDLRGDLDHAALACSTTGSRFTVEKLKIVHPAASNLRVDFQLRLSNDPAVLLRRRLN